MPMYEYECKKCHHQFEELVASSTSTEPVPCPKCANEKTRKLISRTSFALKGDGWFKDHYGLRTPTESKCQQSN